LRKEGDWTGMKQQVFWHTTTEMPSEQDLVPLPEAVDVAIIGGGYTGLSAARTLASAGVKVVVLEAHSMGWGASSRNGGMALTGLKLPLQTLIRKYGRELTKRLFQYSLDSIDTVEQIVKGEKIECGFARSGHLLVANKPKHFDALQNEVEFMSQEFNHRVRLVPPGELKSEIGSDLYHGALVDEVSAGLNPAQFVAGLARAAKEAGATLCARARVTRLGRRKKRFSVQTERGSVGAESVFVATAGYTGNATPGLQRKIIPIGSFIIATERLVPDTARELSPKDRMIFDYKHFLNYFRLWDNRLIFGGRAAFYPENPDTIHRSAEILRREMVGIYPQLKDVRIEYAWGGTLDFAFDTMTHAGEMDGLYYSLGYAGHGLAMGTHLGRTVAEAMIKGNMRDHPFAAFDFPGAPLGLYNGFPWFLPLAFAWQRILDWLE
jgi:glycine/D-amino acid oxidase-like deaminating enzyme